MYYNGTEMDLHSSMEKKKQEWFERDRQRGHNDADIDEDWNNEGAIWAVQEYYGSMGEFSDDDVKALEETFGTLTSEIIDLCEENN